MHAQPREQVRHAARLQHQLHIVPPEQRGEEALLEVSRQRRNRAYPHDLPLGAAPLANHRDELAARGEDGLGVPERHASRFSQPQGARLSLEQRLP